MFHQYYYINYDISFLPFFICFVVSAALTVTNPVISTIIMTIPIMIQNKFKSSPFTTI